MNSGVVHVLYSLDRGGAEVRTVELAEFLGRRFEFLCLSERPGSMDRRVVGGGHSLTKISFKIRNSPRLWRYFRENNRKVVHCHAGPAAGPILALAALAGVHRRIAHFRSDAVGGEQRLAKSVLLAMSRILIKLVATDIVGVSPGALSGAWNENWRSDPRCRVIANGIDTSRIRAGAGVPRPEDERLRLIHVGRSDPAKNRCRVIEIWRESSKRQPTLLTLVGQLDDAERSVLAQLSPGAGNSLVEAVGESDDVPRLIAEADVLLLPSKREGLPGAVLESLALGVPVVASRLPGTEWIASESEGIVLRELEDLNSLWLDAIDQVRGLRRSDVRRSFDLSPFVMERTAEEFTKLWSGSVDA
ncbi:glycosyltransferase [Aeromicrobium sp. CF3.5]|uniref:glycosyltransferase n=1 Tax=Aeromicrobium sp. CF3.5 TaxID=3373078 RepID=UPI003EE52ADA